MEKKSYIEREICSVYGLTLKEIEEIAKAKEEGRLVILKKKEPADQERK